MTKEKARKHLLFARENLNFWRELYVSNERDKSSIADVKLVVLGKTMREERREDYIKNIKESQERISRLERIAL